MHKLIFLFIFIIGTVQWSVSQSFKTEEIPYDVTLLAQQIDAHTSTDTITIYELNDEFFKEIIAQSEKDYHLLVLYADWCKPCIEKMDSIRFMELKNKNVNFYYFSADKSRRIPVIADYLRKNDILTPTFILSEEYKRNVKRRFTRFRDQICSNCEDILGFPSFILFDKQMNVLFKKYGRNDGIRELFREFIIAFITSRVGKIF
ncbi:MAG: thioredoxin family protein [Bacteroidales bacterium]|nr:thioredoxin family protein [Bacteroidales bacterium]